MIRPVSGRSNASLKLAASLQKTPRCRKTGRYLLEGPRFIGDLLARGKRPEFLLLSQGGSELCRHTAKNAHLMDLLVLEVPEDLFRSVVPTGHSQGLAAVCSIPEHDLKDVFTGGTVLALDRVSDPGNAGTAIRSAAAFGCSGVVFLGGSVFPWNPKVTRAAAGLNSAIPVVETESLSAIAALFSSYSFIGADAGATDIARMQSDPPFCLVTGAEAEGLSEDTLSVLNETVSIPMKSNVESLNAGVSASILLYSILRGELPKG